MAPPLNAALVTRRLEDGSYDRLIAETRAEAKVRQAIAAEILPARAYAADACGYHLWVPLPASVDATQVGRMLRGARMTAIGSAAFAAGAGGGAALRVSLGGMIEREDAARRLRVLERALYRTT